MEVKVSQGENGTYDMDPTETRVNPTFVFWYTVSLIWHPTMTTGDHLTIQCPGRFIFHTQTESIIEEGQG